MTNFKIARYVKSQGAMLHQTLSATVVLSAALATGSSALPAADPIHFTSINIAGATDYFVAGINDRGVVVGSTSADGGNTFVGFVRSPGGQIISPILDPNDTDSYTIMRAFNDEDVVAGF